ncbi:C-terminal domain of CinA type S [uncultured Candidatus Thioglobus sp.]|nr:C-terminal domain of CinA type S [uncultured Candidatus Thioglobus sp.]
MSALSEILIKKSLTIAVAESCSGGNLSALLTSESGSSAYFDRGYITYSNQAKMEMLGVSENTLNTYGAVSAETALEMVQGVINNASTDIGVSITGIAGPSSDDTNKPVGMVCFGFYINGNYSTITQRFDGNRHHIVTQSVECAVNTLVTQLLNN